MGQNLESMSQKRPTAELLYELATTGNVEAIKTLCRQGASLEVNLSFFFFSSKPSIYIVSLIFDMF